MSLTITKVKRGRELKVGDRLAPWGGRAATIVSLTPYVGPLAYLWPGGARVARLAKRHPADEWNGTSITVDPDSLHAVVLTRHGDSP